MAKDVSSNDIKEIFKHSFELDGVPRSCDCIFTEITDELLGSNLDWGVNATFVPIISRFDLNDDEKATLLSEVKRLVKLADRLQQPYISIYKDNTFGDYKVSLTDGITGDNDEKAFAMYSVSTDLVATDQDAAEGYDVEEFVDGTAKTDVVLSRKIHRKTTLADGTSFDVERRYFDEAELEGNLTDVVALLDVVTADAAKMVGMSKKELLTNILAKRAGKSKAIKFTVRHKKTKTGLSVFVNGERVDFAETENVMWLLKLILEATEDLNTEVGIFEIYEDYFDENYEVSDDPRAVDERKHRTEQLNKLYQLINRINKKIRLNTSLSKDLIVKDDKRGLYLLNPELK